jgi:hypothetical protein
MLVGGVLLLLLVAGLVQRHDFPRPGPVLKYRSRILS